MQLCIGRYKKCFHSVLTKTMYFYNVSSDVNVNVAITFLKAVFCPNIAGCEITWVGGLESSVANMS